MTGEWRDAPEAANAEQRLAEEYLRDTGCNLFLTGRAGTGKTTFLHKVKADCPKRMVVTAPTGVAAINAGGVTLHSFFQLPFGPLVPGNDPPGSRFRFSRAKIDIARNLDLLIIDEISMVRADLLDGVDSVLRRLRSSGQPFGGVQLLMIGDLFQLPPVVKEEEWRLLQTHYDAPYFFCSKALQRTDLVTIELQRIYRQTDRRFIDLLNGVRNNRLDGDMIEDLNRRQIAGGSPVHTDGTIILCTHNHQADRINGERLEAIGQRVHRFEAEIEGDFPEHAFPTAATLHLKPGAQVMFVRNDPSPEKRYFNGKIGTIARIRGASIYVAGPEDADEIGVAPVDWENVEYALDRETQTLDRKTIGVFRQYPLRLAWAITIHKSQGLTFDSAVIDANAAFAHGQVYVALSRCRTLDGVFLSTPLPPAALKIDPVVHRFSAAMERRRPSADALHDAKVRYQQRLLTECFDFKRLRSRLNRLAALVLGNPGTVRVVGTHSIGALQRRTEAEICTVGDNFLKQLQRLFSPTVLPAEDPTVVERIAKASAYFGDKLASDVERCLTGLQYDTDNKALGRKLATARRMLDEAVAVKSAAVRSCAAGFSPSAYLRAVSAALTDRGGPPPQTAGAHRAPTYTEADIAHPALFERLKAWRSRQAAEEGIPAYRVLHQKTLVQIAVNQPDTLAALKSIKGIGDRLADRYGAALVALVGAYRSQEGVGVGPAVLPTPAPSTALPEKPPQSSTDTRRVTLDLFQQGLTVEQIAQRRGLARSTIEGHLAHWVAEGTVAIGALLPDPKIGIIEQTLGRMEGMPLGAVKQALGDGISYAEIKWVAAHLKRQGPSDPLSSRQR